MGTPTPQEVKSMYVDLVILDDLNFRRPGPALPLPFPELLNNCFAR